LVIVQKRVAGLSAPALERFVRRARRAAGLAGRVNVLVTGSSEIRSLNRRFRAHDKATDVLSFPALLPARNLRRIKKSALSNRLALAGDIAISAEIAAQNAAQLDHTVADEIKILTLHGILHLAGFDHERDNGKMARKETALRRILGLPSGLIERAQWAGPSARPGVDLRPSERTRRAS
jgi:probable rRNA maturation factor